MREIETPQLNFKDLDNPEKFIEIKDNLAKIYNLQRNMGKTLDSRSNSQILTGLGKISSSNDKMTASLLLFSIMGISSPR